MIKISFFSSFIFKGTKKVKSNQVPHFTERSVNVKLLFIHGKKGKRRRKKAVDAWKISENNHLSLSTPHRCRHHRRITHPHHLYFLSTYNVSFILARLLRVFLKCTQNSNIPTLATILYEKYSNTHTHSRISLKIEKMW